MVSKTSYQRHLKTVHKDYVEKDNSDIVGSDQNGFNDVINYDFGESEPEKVSSPAEKTKNSRKRRRSSKYSPEVYDISKSENEVSEITNTENDSVLELQQNELNNFGESEPEKVSSPAEKTKNSRKRRRSSKYSPEVYDISKSENENEVLEITNTGNDSVLELQQNESNNFGESEPEKVSSPTEETKNSRKRRRSSKYLEEEYDDISKIFENENDLSEITNTEDDSVIVLQQNESKNIPINYQDEDFDGFESEEEENSDVDVEDKDWREPNNWNSASKAKRKKVSKNTSIGKKHA